MTEFLRIVETHFRLHSNAKAKYHSEVEFCVTSPPTKIKYHIAIVLQTNLSAIKPLSDIAILIDALEA